MARPQRWWGPGDEGLWPLTRKAQCGDGAKGHVRGQAGNSHAKGGRMSERVRIEFTHTPDFFSAKLVRESTGKSIGLECDHARNPKDWERISKAGKLPKK